MKYLLTTLLIFSSSVFAEYRVYQYIVKNKIVTAPDQNNSHFVTTTLNPVTYLAYNGGSNLYQIDLLRTWICPGFTGAKKEICKSPYEELTAGVLQ